MPRACYARLCDAQFLQRRKARHTIHTERLTWEEMSRSEKMDSVLRNYFAGGRIRKTEAKDF